MWFTTMEGINRYDGYRFTVYKHNAAKTSSISNNFVNDLAEDKTGNIWIATGSGLDKFNRKTDTFTHYFPKTAGDFTAKTIFIDSRERIWLGTLNGLYLFNPSTGKFISYKHTATGNSISHDVIYDIAEDSNGMLWIATEDGLNVYSPKTERFICYKNKPGNKLSIGANWIKAVYKDQKGNMWAGTQGGGIARFNPIDQTFTNFIHNDKDPFSICHNDILSFAEDSKGNLWIGTENGGISVLNEATGSFRQYQFDSNDNSSLSNNSIYCIYKDDINNMWIGTWSGGINFLAFHGEKFGLYREIPGNSNSLSSNIVLCVAGDSDGIMWIGTDGGGLNRFDKNKRKFTHYRHDKDNANTISSDYVLSVVEIEPGLLLIGYQRGGFDLFNTKTGAITHHLPIADNSNSLSTLTVNVVLKDRSGLLWLGTWGGGVDVYDRKKKTFIHYKNSADSNGIDNDFINALYEDNAGNIWVTTDVGVNVLDKKSNRFSHYRSNPSNNKTISHNMVESISTGRAGQIMVVTATGLNLFDAATKSFKAYSEKDGLSNNMIHDAQEDDKGNLWISSNQGISKLNIANKTCRNYVVSDGLQGSEFNSRCSYQASDGEMFFGGPEGLNFFYPDSIKDNDFVPPVYFTAFDIFNKPVSISSGKDAILSSPISETSEITISYSQSVFTFEFSALNYTLPEKNQYAYKLEGFDEDWNYVGNKRTTTYTNLNPGTYKLSVMAANNDGVWNPKPTTITIHVMPPFWKTWWFILLVGICIVATAITFYQFRINIIKSQKIKLEQQVKEQTIQLLQSAREEKRTRKEAELANKELARKNVELEQFAYVVSHDLQEPLRTTTGFASLLQERYKGKLDEKAETYFNLIVDASERMKVLITDLLEFSRLGSKRELKEVDCNQKLKEVIADLNVSITEASASISYTVLPVINGYTTELKQLFQNLLLNAIKFRKPDTTPEIHISAEAVPGYWQFAVKDNGIGIDTKHQDRIFVIFQRLHTRKEYEGSGIGLANCKKIVELHGGKIWIESTPGQGTTFYFTIPNND